MKISDATGVASLIVTIITSIISPSIYYPFLTYYNSNSHFVGKAEYLRKFTISNPGLAPAKNVRFSFESDTETIVTLVSRPFLSNDSHSDETKFSRGIAYVKTAILPAGSELIITITTNMTRKLPGVDTENLSSDEVEGYERAEGIMIII